MRSKPRSAALAAGGHTARARAVSPGRPLAQEVDRAPSFTRDELLSANDVAEALQIKRSTALDYMRRGIIPAHKIGRRWYALRPQLEDYLARVFEPSRYR